MWLYLKTGFYSIVYKRPCKTEELLVRTRCKDDIETLQKLLKKEFQFDDHIVESPKADYAYRMIVPRDKFASFLALAALDLNYDNFKNTIPDKDQLRHDAYLRCWKAMHEWQRDIERVKKRY